MLVMGLCQYRADENEAFLQRLGEPIRYWTMDGSPQAGWDWLLHGHITINSTDSINMFRDSLEYIRLAHMQRGHRDDMRDVENEELAECPHMQRLQELRCVLDDKLQLKQGLPCAVGASKAGLRHKIHALLHSERMTSNSWRSAVQNMNATFSICADMGTESLICNTRVPLRTLFGTWVHSDPNADSDEELAGDDGDAGASQYKMQPSPLHILKLFWCGGLPGGGQCVGS